MFLLKCANEIIVSSSLYPIRSKDIKTNHNLTLTWHSPGIRMAFFLSSSAFNRFSIRLKIKLLYSNFGNENAVCVRVIFPHIVYRQTVYSVE